MGCQSTKPGDKPDDRLKVVIQYAHLMKEMKFLEALELVGPDVTWQPFSGPPIIGRDNLKAFFEQNRQQGVKRQGLSHWWMEGEPSENGQSYIAKRHVSYEKPNSTPFRVWQKMEVENGLITKAVVEAATWEVNLAPNELPVGLRACEPKTETVTQSNVWRRIVHGRPSTVHRFSCCQMS